LEKVKNSSLIVPIYINEKIVIDMLAIIDDGFSKVSQINSVERNENSNKKIAGSNISSGSIINKFLKIDFKGDLDNLSAKINKKSISKEKVHTNVSLLSKFRSYLIEKQMLKNRFDIEQINLGDFVEIEGELQKNPLIDFLEAFIDIYKIADIFVEPSQLGDRKINREKKENDQKIIKQIRSFSDELKHSGTIDFILSNEKGEIVLSTQEQYLSNDNISEILGGTFKVLGKVIAICENDTESINLLRKTTLSIMPEDYLEEMFATFKSDDMKELNLPEFKTKIKGPAMIVIPIAIYA